MKKDIYTISSALPPAELKERMKWEAAIGNRMYGKQLKTVWKWKSEYEFTIYLVVSEIDSEAGAYWGIGQRSISLNFAAGASRTMFFSPVFCGNILPDGSGSVIQGCFRTRLLEWIMFVSIYGIWFTVLIMTKNLLGRLILLCFLLKSMWLPRNIFRPEQVEASALLWDVLGCIVEKAERPREN